MAFELIRPFKEARTLVAFQFGTTEVLATTWKGEVIFSGKPYLSEPGIEIELPKQTGGLSEDALTITLPLTREKVNSPLHSMATRLAGPRAVPKTEVRIFQLLVDGQEQRIIYLYEGTLDRSRKNPEGRAGVVALEFASELRAGLDRISLGRRCDPECDAVFGGTGCGNVNGFGKTIFSPSEYFSSGAGGGANSYGTPRSAHVLCTFDPDNARKVDLELDPAFHPGMAANDETFTLRSQPQNWWVGSFLKSDGVSIPIQAWAQNNDWFILSRLPPLDWDSKSIFLQLDCNRTVTACSLRWGGTTTRFNGLGYGIPAYNPALDLPNEST